MNTINELRTALSALEDEVRELAHLDDITDEQDARLDEALTAAEEARSELAKAEERAARIAAIQDQRANGETREAPGYPAPQVMRRKSDDIDTRTASPADVRDAAMRAIERAGRTYLDKLDDPRADALERAMSRGESENYSSALVARAIVATSKPAYERAFIKGITGRSDEVTEEERAALSEARAQSLTGNAGGFGVPVLIDPTIMITNGQSRNPLITAARTVSITTDQWKGVSSPHASWSMDASGTQVSDDTVAIAQPTIKTEKPQGFLPYDLEVGMDYPGFANEFGRVLSQGYTYLVASQLAVGTGVSPQTTGIFVGSTTTVDVATDNTLAAADIDAVYAATPEDFRANGMWVMNVDVENEIRAFGSGSATSRFTVDQTAGGITLLNGKPVVLTDHAPAWSATDGQNILVFGDMEHFLLVQRLGMTLSNVPHLFGANQRPTGQSGLYAYARFGSGVTVVNAFRRLKNITT